MLLGVTIVVCGSSSSRTRAPFHRSRARRASGRLHRVEDHRDVGIVGQNLGDRRNALDAAQHADLERVDRHVLEQAARLVGDPLGVEREDRLDAAVSCTVIAVSTDSGWQPMLASVRMSAWMPAPPEGSDAARS